MDTKLVIGHFYPDLLNLYGDRGNVLALMRRANLRGIEVEVRRISIGDDVAAGDIDLGFIGGRPYRLRSLFYRRRPGYGAEHNGR